MCDPECSSISPEAASHWRCGCRESIRLERSKNLGNLLHALRYTFWGETFFVHELTDQGGIDEVMRKRRHVLVRAGFNRCSPTLNRGLHGDLLKVLPVFGSFSDVARRDCGDRSYEHSAERTNQRQLFTGELHVRTLVVSVVGGLRLGSVLAQSAERFRRKFEHPWASSVPPLAALTDGWSEAQQDKRAGAPS